MGLVAGLDFYCNRPRCRDSAHLGAFQWPDLAVIGAELAGRGWTYDAETNTAFCPKHRKKKP